MAALPGSNQRLEARGRPARSENGQDSRATRMNPVRKSVRDPLAFPGVDGYCHRVEIARRQGGRGGIAVTIAGCRGSKKYAEVE